MELFICIICLGISNDWAIAVHPYDDGNPEDNLWDCCSIYTFDTLQNVVNYANSQLETLYKVSSSGLDIRPQQILYASEQGWAYNNVSMNDYTRARNICYAQNLSLKVKSVISVTHNYFHTSPNDGTQNGQSFGLLPVSIWGNLSNADGYPTYEAYKSTNQNVWGVTSSHYCCVNWNVGCV